MKTIASIIFILLIVLGLWLVLKADTTTEEPVVTGEEVALTDGSYKLATSSNSLGWEGSKTLIPGYTDKGTIQITEGTLEVVDGKIVGGKFVIDMTSISALSTGRGKDEDKLSGHLKSEDFFDAEKYPTSVFEITGATAEGEITGNLTIKETTAPITFPIQLSESEGKITAKGRIDLDRTIWDVRYGSGKFFQNLGDNIISDIFTLTLDLTAEPVL